jgi:predicted signal transduction protein with EAL and GGDEF domain
MAWKARVSCSKSTTGTRSNRASVRKPRATCATNASDGCARGARRRSGGRTWPGTVFGVVLHPIAAARLGIRDAIADRLRAELGAPIVVGETSLRLTASVGHAPLAACRFARVRKRRLPAPHLRWRRRRQPARGPSAPLCRAAKGKQRTQSQLTEEVPSARWSGAITAWFQPQIEVRTGAVAGFEALARWNHPSLGLLGPGQFLGAAENAGRMEDLGTRIRQTPEALRAWDAAGHLPITVSVNACGCGTAQPQLRRRGRMGPRRGIGIAPERLIVEVLESVAADAGRRCDHGHARGPAQPGHRPRSG